MDFEKKLFYYLSRSHTYWGRKHTYGLLNIFKDIKPGDIVIDPFCGSGTPVIVALSKDARVLASDLNPMSVFITKVLIKPLNIPLLLKSFEKVKKSVSKNILENYEIKCPECDNSTYFNYLIWKRKNNVDIPISVKDSCCPSHQKKNLNKLGDNEIERQIKLANITPKYWYPKERIVTNIKRKPDLDFYYKLFTCRNLSSLSELFHAIELIKDENCRNALFYVFTSILYSCSKMQMHSYKYPSSSRGWTAPRFYVPPIRQEKNVWRSFENRFNNFIKLKKKLNSLFINVKIANTLEEFEKNNMDAYIFQSDYLDFPIRKIEDIKYVFLDPPYNEDVDYMGFSIFWGSWLKMEFDMDKSLQPGKLPYKNIARDFQKFLFKINKNTIDNCNVTLAFGAKKDIAWSLMSDAIINSEYEKKDEDYLPILWDNPQKRGERKVLTDYYLNLVKRKDSKLKLSSSFSPEKSLPLRSYRVLHSREHSEFDFKGLSIYFSAFCYLYKENADRLRRRVREIIPQEYKDILVEATNEDINKWILNPEVNCKNYHSLCKEFIQKILQQDGWQINNINYTLFDSFTEKANNIDNNIYKYAAFIASKGKQKIFFCFDDQDKLLLEKISRKVCDEDKNTFNVIAVMIVKSHDDMSKKRCIDKAEKWERGFFICFEEIIKKINDINVNEIYEMKDIFETDVGSDKSKNKIKSFKAEIVDNISIGKNKEHYKLKFKTKGLKDIVPGQFIMLDTRTIYEKQKDNDIHIIDSLKEIKKNENVNFINKFSPISLLKRPFGIHRAFYKYFEEDYIKYLSLPKTLSTITHTVFPDEFEIFYKVIKDGVGTNELTKLKKNDKIQMLGPLGCKTYFSKTPKFDEIHLIGGGVGMAPLIYLGQALKYYSFKKVIAFIGIDSFESLIENKERLAESFAENDVNAYIYIDDLLNLGIDKEYIFLSHEASDSSIDNIKRIPEDNIYEGFVSKQYEKYLNKQKEKKILVFSCGPMPMLEALNKITKKREIPLYVFFEKWMACGIGVCLSCVCKIESKKDKNSFDYARVCTDGPIFKADKLKWDL